MDRRFGRYIASGLMVGSALGLLWGPMIGNAALGIGIGALAGLFIGWFAAAAALKRGKVEGDQESQDASTAPGDTRKGPDR